MRAISLLLLLFSSLASGAPKVVETIEYYNVEPTSPATMLAELFSASPIMEDDEQFLGYTNSYVEWEWFWKTRNGKCRIVEVTSSVDITYTMPRLVPHYSNSKVKQIWNRWYPRLMYHERNHGQHAIDTAYLGEQEISRLQPTSDCKTLDAKASEIANQLIEQMGTLDEEYDARTNHGSTEGVDIEDYLK